MPVGAAEAERIYASVPAIEWCLFGDHFQRATLQSKHADFMQCSRAPRDRECTRSAYCSVCLVEATYCALQAVPKYALYKRSRISLKNFDNARHRGGWFTVSHRRLHRADQERQLIGSATLTHHL